MTGLRRQRRRVTELAALVEADRAAMERARFAAKDAIRRRLTSPLALLGFFAAGLAMTRVAPSVARLPATSLMANLTRTAPLLLTALWRGWQVRQRRRSTSTG